MPIFASGVGRALCMAALTVGLAVAGGAATLAGPDADDDRAAQAGNATAPKAREKGAETRAAPAQRAHPRQSSDYWRAYEAKLSRLGLLRVEREPDDAPFTNADLVRHFGAIMLHKEYAKKDATFAKSRKPRRLKKLAAVAGLHVVGGSVTDTDRRHIADLVARLNRVTGVRLVEGPDDPVIRLMILDREERRWLARRAADSRRWRFIARHVANGMRGAVCSTYYSRSRKVRGRVDYLIVIPAELGGIMRRSCIEEELGQTFGPGADYAEARPSIFNDDEEFALLTTHDEYLLRILYDPRLEAGMTSSEAMPLVRRIVEDLRPGG